MDQKPKRGRPPKWDKIDPDQVRQCAIKLWKNEEIAAFFQVSVDTIERHFAGVLADARQNGKAKIRDLQWKRALEGSDRMILHLSEHHLGEHPVQKNELSTGEAGFKIVIEDYAKK